MLVLPDITLELDSTLTRQRGDQMVRILNGLGSIFGVFLTFGPAVSFSGDRAT